MITSNCTWHVHLPRSVGHTFNGYILAAIGSTWHFCDLRGTQAFSQRGVRVSFGHPIADFGHPNIYIFWWIMQWDEKELDTQFTPNVYFWTPNSPQMCIFGHPILKSWLKPWWHLLEGWTKVSKIYHAVPVPAMSTP